MVFNSMRGTTYLFGGTVPADTTYGPSEFWEYIPNATSGRTARAARRRRPTSASRRTASTASAARRRRRSAPASASRATSPASAGTCSNVPAGLPDDTCPSDQACDATQQCKKPIGQACTPRRVRQRLLRRRRLLRHRVQRSLPGVQPRRQARHLLVRADGGRGSGDLLRLRPEQGRNCDGAGKCATAPKANGKPCTAGGQCSSRYCVDGVCCNSACAGTC